MKFIIDAQLSRRLALQLVAAGHDAVHTLDLDKGNRTADNEIISIATRQNRVLVTKDADFVTIFLIRGAPPKLLLVSTGNISNKALFHLFSVNLAALVKALAVYNFVELGASVVTIHT